MGRRDRATGWAHAAIGDCEQIRAGWLGQPANALSSLAFVAAALPLARSARAHRSRAWAAVAVASAFEGVGSVGYHGPGGRWSRAVHDAGLVALVVALGAARAASPGRRPPLPALALGAAAAVVHARSRTGGPWCCPGCRVQGHAAFHLLAAAALATSAPATPAVPRP